MKPNEQGKRKNANSSNAKARETVKPSADAIQGANAPALTGDALAQTAAVATVEPAKTEQGNAETQIVVTRRRELDDNTPSAQEIASKRGKRIQKGMLTRVERRLLDALLDPETRTMKVADLCRQCGISKTRYYIAMRDPAFEAQRKSAITAQIRRQAASFVKAAAETAITAGRDGFQDRRLLLAMSGDFVPRQRQEVNVTGRILVGVVGVNPDSL